MYIYLIINPDSTIIQYLRRIKFIKILENIYKNVKSEKSIWLKYNKEINKIILVETKLFLIKSTR